MQGLDISIDWASVYTFGGPIIVCIIPHWMTWRFLPSFPGLQWAGTEKKSFKVLRLAQAQDSHKHTDRTEVDWWIHKQVIMNYKVSCGWTKQLGWASVHKQVHQMCTESFQYQTYIFQKISCLNSLRLLSSVLLTQCKRWYSLFSDRKYLQKNWDTTDTWCSITTFMVFSGVICKTYFVSLASSRCNNKSRGPVCLANLFVWHKALTEISLMFQNTLKLTFLLQNRIINGSLLWFSIHWTLLCVSHIDQCLHYSGLSISWGISFTNVSNLPNA